MNVFSATGNLGQDCRKGEGGGTSVVNFSVAVKSGFGDRAKTMWIDCALWGKQAESKLPDYLTKGQQVAVSGELSTEEKDGKAYLKLRCNSVDLVGSKSDNGGQQQSYSQTAQQSRPQPQAGMDDFDDDIPF